MHNFFVLFVSLQLFVSSLAVASATQWMPKSYGDQGWTLRAKAEGDLNKDGVADLVMILEAPEGVVEPGNFCDPDNGFSEAAARRLIIAFTDDGGSYEVVVDDPKVLLRSDEGGVFGDPLSDLTIVRGSVVIDYFAGSRWRWGKTERFRYQDGGFYLIGLLDFTVDSLSNASLSYDYNPLSDKVLVTAQESPDAELRAQEPLCVQCRIGEDCSDSSLCYGTAKPISTGEYWFDVDDKPLVKLEAYRCWQEDPGLLKFTGFQTSE